MLPFLEVLMGRSDNSGSPQLSSRFGLA